MVKYYLLLFVYTSTWIQVIAQFAGIPYDKQKEIYNTHTYIVLFGDDPLNEKLKQTIKTYWTATDYTFIPLSEVDERISEKGNSMLLPMTKGNQSLDYMYYVMIETGKKSVQSYTYGHWYAYLIIPSVTDFNRRMENIIQAMENILYTVKEQELKGGNAKISKSLVEYYNSKSPVLKEGQLYINKALLHKDLQSGKENIEALYKYPYTLCDTTTIERIISAKREKSYYFVVDGRQTTIYDASNGEIVYCNVEFTPIYEIDKNVLIDLMSTILSE